MRPDKPILLYRGTCAKCRLISRLVVGLSLGLVRRVPVLSPEARDLYDAYFIKSGKLALVGKGRMFTDARAVLEIVPMVLLAIRSKLASRASNR